MTHSVLLAEDDRPIRTALERALTLEGYEVTAVADGIQALAAAHRERPDVILLDVMMPGIDGLQVCQVLRAEQDRTPILMLTARVETADRIAGLDAGADDYVVKPFEVEEVFARLRALLRRTTAGAATDEGGTGAGPGATDEAGEPRGPRRRTTPGSRTAASWRRRTCGSTGPRAAPGAGSGSWS